MSNSIAMWIAAMLILAAVTTDLAEDGAGNRSQTKTGVVRKVDADSKSIIVMVAHEMTFTTSDDTVIRQNGSARTLADVRVGDTVTVVYSRLAEQLRVASRITIVAARPPAPTGEDVRVDFTLNTKDSVGDPLQQKRHYWFYRPRSVPRTTRAPMVLVMDRWDPTLLRRKADQAGFLVVSCSFSGNSTGTPGRGWINDDPRICGYEDYDYLTELINRVRAAENGGDAFVVGLSKGGHMSLAYACERPGMIQAAAALGEFMGLTSNRPTAPVPMILFQGTSDANVPFTMVKDTADAWRAVNGLLDMPAVTTFESSVRIPGSVRQTTWHGGIDGTQVAFVTIVGGGHNYPGPDIQTGYDFTDGLWAFFSQFLTDRPARPTIVSQPVDNVQLTGQPASFRVSAISSRPVTYQWQKDSQDIAGATQNWLTIPAVSATDDHAAYRVVVSDSTRSVTSETANLRVLEAAAGPAILVHPTSLTVAAGHPATFTVRAEGTPPLRYQWRRCGMDIAGATDASYSLPITAPFDSGVGFSVVVADREGRTASIPATLTVTRPADAPIILTNPARVRLLVGQSGSFHVSAWSKSPLRYQWQKGTITGHMTDIPGATEATYRPPPAISADRPTLFRCIVSNSAGSVASASEMLFVTTDTRSPKEITSVTDAVAPLGSPFTYTIASSGGTIPITYSADPLPPGLMLDSASGRVSGTLRQPGTHRIVIAAANSAGRASATLNLTMTADPPVTSIVAWREAHFGASARDPAIAGVDADPDRDGLRNVEEFQGGMNPLD